MMDDFTIITALDLPLPWPVSDTIRALQGESGNLIFELWYFPDGHMEAVVLEKYSEDLITEVNIEKIEINGDGIGKMIITAEFKGESNSLSISINHTPVTGKNDHILPPSFNPSDPISHKLSVDESAINRCLKIRADRLKSYHDDGYSQNDFDTRRKDLDRECRLLSTSIDKIAEGDMDHVVTASLHLRKIVGKGKGNHLLQDCASFGENSLLVWESSRIDGAWTPDQFGDAYWKEVWRLSISPTNFFNRQTDLDAWLENDAIGIDGKKLSNIMLIQTLGDKIGAHADLKGRDFLHDLERVKHNDVEEISRFLVSTSRGILALYEQLQSSR